MYKTTLLIISTTILLVACQGGHGGAAQGDISKNRRTAFKSFMPTFSDMRKMVNGDLAFEPNTFKSKAAQFTKEAREPFEYFQNDPNGNGDALPTIWSNPQEFKVQQEKFFSAVDKLNEVAQTDKIEDIKVALDNVGANCKACHQSYRAPE